MKKINNNSADGANNTIDNTVAPETAKTVKRAYSVSPVFQVIKSANRILSLVSGEITKQRSIELALKQPKSPYSDPDSFYEDFQKQKNEVVDSVKFLNYCKAKGVQPEAVAENVVYEGKSFMNKVHKEGPGILHDRLAEYGIPIFTVETSSVEEKSNE